jgi:hypothetical protein
MIHKYIWCATAETTTRYTENKPLPLIGMHTSKEKNHEGNAGASQKMCLGEYICARPFLTRNVQCLHT